jgi:hypothetical protein
MPIELSTNYAQIEEDCLTPLDVTLRDPSPDANCRYHLLFVFNSSTDAEGDLAGRKFAVLPQIPHRFWIKPAGKGALSVWGLKECPSGPSTTGVLTEFPPIGHYEEHLGQLNQLLISTADPGYTIVDMHLIALPIQDCDNFDRAAAAIGIGFGTGVGAGGAAATLLTALGTPAAAGAGGAAGGGAAAGGLFGAAGSITAGGILLAVGIALIVAIVVGLILWFVFKKDCCELGVEDSQKGTQGTLVNPMTGR